MRKATTQMTGRIYTSHCNKYVVEKDGTLRMIWCLPPDGDSHVSHLLPGAWCHADLIKNGYYKFEEPKEHLFDDLYLRLKS